MIAPIPQPHKRSFYREHLTPTLRRNFDTILEASRDEQLELFEEIALLRHCVADIVELYSAAHSLPFSENKAQVVLHTSHILRDCVNDVVNAVATAKKFASKDAIPQFNFFIQQISAIVAQEADIKTADRINNHLLNIIEHIGEKPKLFDTETARSVLAPDKTALLMDATVPHMN